MQERLSCSSATVPTSRRKSPQPWLVGPLDLFEDIFTNRLWARHDLVTKDPAATRQAHYLQCTRIDIDMKETVARVLRTHLGRRMPSCVLRSWRRREVGASSAPPSTVPSRGQHDPAAGVYQLQRVEPAEAPGFG